MIDAEQLERAERILQIVYGQHGVPDQLRKMEVEIESFNKFIQHRTDTCQSQRPIHWRRTPPQVHQMYNTLLLHFFLVGLICGRDEKARIT